MVKHEGLMHSIEGSEFFKYVLKYLLGRGVITNFKTLCTCMFLLGMSQIACVAGLIFEQTRSGQL